MRQAYVIMNRYINASKSPKPVAENRWDGVQWQRVVSENKANDTRPPSKLRGHRHPPSDSGRLTVWKSPNFPTEGLSKGWWFDGWFPMFLWKSQRRQERADAASIADARVKKLRPSSAIVDARNDHIPFRYGRLDDVEECSYGCRAQQGSCLQLP